MLTDLEAIKAEVITLRRLNRRLRMQLIEADEKIQALSDKCYELGEDIIQLKYDHGEM